MDCPKAALFDLDDTLAESFKAPSEAMVARVARLAELMPVAILSGASYERMKEEILDPILGLGKTVRLYAFPDSASIAYTLVDDAWQEAYSLAFTPEQLERIRSIIEECVSQHDIASGMPYEPQILLEKTQVRYAALGLNATEADKNTWDPDQVKRRALKTLLDQKLPECEVLIGGRTTIDITRKGVDKAYGVRWFSEYLHIPAQEMFYVGDALYEGGNDQVVISTGIQARQTSGPEETLSILDELLAIAQ
ncbi:MAG: HAD hydrolase family protein [Candidatus Pacebacteria bacterium]|nr:HAD hydrolase family protein [Candidatus Paceibacterota bacterium]